MRQWQGFLTLAAPVAAFAVLVSGVHAQSAPTVGSGWKTLFDGKDLEPVARLQVRIGAGGLEGGRRHALEEHAAG